MIRTVIVGYGLAGRAFHAPLIRRQPGLELYGIVARDARVRASAVSELALKGFGSLDEALADPLVDLVVVATPHDSHADLTVRALDAGKHCVVDKVMALTTAEADRMIAARDRSGRMLSVFQNRRWDWDYLTVRGAVQDGRIGGPSLFESAVCRYAPPRAWRGDAKSAGTILHDWGAHLVDQALMMGLGPCRRLSAWVTPAPWDGVDTGGHGRVVMEFGDVLFQIETSRVSRLDKPRWWVLGTDGGLVQHGLDPQEAALRTGNLDAADQPPSHRTILRSAGPDGATVETPLTTRRGTWDDYYANVVGRLEGTAPLAVTAEQGREVVRVLDAAAESSAAGRPVEGPWGV